MRPLISLLLVAAFFSGCSLFDKKEVVVVPLIENLPSIKSVMDSLNTAGATSVKWAISEGKVIHTIDEKIDWIKEFDVFAKSNVNQLRYREAYDVTDTIIGQKRTVLFVSKTDAQEIKKMEIHLENGRITYYEIEKSRDNVISSSDQRFVFDCKEYSLDVDQQIQGVFSNQQYVHGTILNNESIWRGIFDLGDIQMPVQALINLNNKTFFIKNSRELIGFNHYSEIDDTLVFSSDNFDSRFHVKLTDDSTIVGRWINEKSKTVRTLKFSAQKNIPYRFMANIAPEVNLTGYHKTFFYDKEGNIEDSTLLKIDQNKHIVTASVLTETGDYRFLDGVIRNDSLLMSTMDGTHAYYFAAAIEGESLKGSFRSGCCYQQNWSSNLNSQFELRNPEEITTMLPDSVVSFSFPDENGNIISLSDDEFKGKPVVITLMGTWCSNCLDEAQFLKEVEAVHGAKGLKIIGLDFELISDSAKAVENIKRHRKSLNINYPVLLASLSATKQKAHLKVPYLNGVFSYPTMIVLNKDHNVVKVHTGFSGPATGPLYYKAFRMEYLALFDELVK